jgi:hypothetical protein
MMQVKQGEVHALHVLLIETYPELQLERQVFPSKEYPLTQVEQSVKELLQVEQGRVHLVHTYDWSRYPEGHAERQLEL